MTPQEARRLLAGYFGPTGTVLNIYLELQLGHPVSQMEADEIVRLATRADRPEHSYGAL